LASLSAQLSASIHFHYVIKAQSTGSGANAAIINPF